MKEFAFPVFTIMVFLCCGMCLAMGRAPVGSSSNGVAKVLLEGPWRVMPDPTGISMEQHWENPSFPDGGWKTVEMPGWFDDVIDLYENGKTFGPFEGVELTQVGVYNGVVWLRRTLEAPSAWQDGDAFYFLCLGAVDDMDVTFLNGRKIGQTDDKTNPRNYWAAPREYPVPPDLIHFGGENLVAVMALDQHQAGGIRGPEIALVRRTPEAQERLAEERRRKEQYVKAVTRGAGYMPWQKKGPSEKEIRFREQIERRKDEMQAARLEVDHPALRTEEDFKRARANIEAFDWAGQWYEKTMEVADYVVAQPDEYVEDMISELSAVNPYGFTCPNCVGQKSIEGANYIRDWNYKEPDILRCRCCGHVYPDPEFPETAELVCPRSGQTFTYYLNEQERAHPDDRSGKYAWKWVGFPLHVSFSGIVRGNKQRFMCRAAEDLAIAYRMTGDVKYAERAIDILARLAHCYRLWLYRDYWGTVADCDPLYAAWHGTVLDLEWKRHLSENAFDKDTYESAAMLRSLWGAGRAYPGMAGVWWFQNVCLAYDLLHDACRKDGSSLWTKDVREKVERDLLMEWMLEAEPYLGGRRMQDVNKHQATSNLSPHLYKSFAMAGRCLGIVEWAENALTGYGMILDYSFGPDGVSYQSPIYNATYVQGLVVIPEILNGFQWPRGAGSDIASVNIFKTHLKTRLMMYAMKDMLLPDGTYLPLDDTITDYKLSPYILCVGMKHFPGTFGGGFSTLTREGREPECAIFDLTTEALREKKDLEFDEVVYPTWREAIFRHGKGEDSTTLTLSFNEAGTHRHYDCLSLFYVDRARTMLGDHGYMGDTPLNEWIASTFSHNLVVVDGQEQMFETAPDMPKPQLHFAAITPAVSVVEASSPFYRQCEAYSRLVALMKGPDAQTFAVDIFRVKGGSEHDYRAFSELASSDAEDGELIFEGVDMPEQAPLPDFKGSTTREHIFGLRDIREADPQGATWSATWSEKGRAFRLHMLSPCDVVRAANGPGQEVRDQLGRRVRYLSVMNKGDNRESTFVAVHVPSGPDGGFPVRHAELLDVPESAGPDAVAIRMESEWGEYLVLNRFEKETEVNGIRFQGEFGVFCRGDKDWLMSVGASTMRGGEFGFEKSPARWSGNARRRSDWSLRTGVLLPKGWEAPPEGCEGYVLVKNEEATKGFPVESVGRREIEVKRFPLEEVTHFELPALRYMRR